MKTTIELLNYIQDKLIMVNALYIAEMQDSEDEEKQINTEYYQGQQDILEQMIKDLKEQIQAEKDDPMNIFKEEANETSGSGTDSKPGAKKSRKKK